MKVQAHTVAGLLIKRVIEGASLKSIVEEARAFAVSRSGITKSYTALAGVTVTKRSVWVFASTLFHGPMFPTAITRCYSTLTYRHRLPV